jgi:hypothetical protein
MRLPVRILWQRDLLVALLASLATVAGLLPIGWTALQQQRERTDDACQLALQAARLARQDADQARDQAQRAMLDQASDLLANAGGPGKSDAEAMQVMTSAVAPEVPQGAYLLIDKKAKSYAVGDIVVFRVGQNNYLGRVLKTEKAAEYLTIGRNNEADRQVPLGQVLGRGVLNTR